MSNLIFCTTFNQKLYDFSGKKMLESWKNTGSEGEWWCFSEDMPTTIYDKKPSIINTKECRLLVDFVEKWKNVIATEYGGNQDKWVCEDPKICDYNRQFMRWFYKVIALSYIKEVVGTKQLIVFVDCDSTFIKKVTYDTVVQIIDKHDYTYVMGKFRRENKKGIESGLMTFTGDGFKVIDLCYEKYISGGFLQYRRWDDGYVWHQILCENPEIKHMDLAGKILNPGGDPAGMTAWKNYIVHNKGLHGRSGLIPHIVNKSHKPTLNCR